MRYEYILRMVGNAIVLKWKKRAEAQGTEHAARMMRKQGYPLALSLLILVGRV